jgi:urate oxidase
VRNNPPVARARVELSERPWERLTVDGRPHPHAFSRPGGDAAHVARHPDAAGSARRVRPGGSRAGEVGAVGLRRFLRDGFTTLKETRRPDPRDGGQGFLAYKGAPADFDGAFQGIRRTLLETFAGHDSASVQHTLNAMGEAVLEKHAEVAEVHLSLPNTHHILVDLSPFGLENNNEVFVATEEPFGLIDSDAQEGLTAIHR